MKKIYTILLIAAMAAHGTSAQTLWAWGANLEGQVGNGTTNPSGERIRQQINTETTWIDIDGGYQHSVALKSDGTIWAWGYNGTGEIGDNSTTNATTPKQVGTDKDWKDIDAGYTYTTAIKNNGTLWMWGSCNAINPSLVPLQYGTDTDWKSVHGGWSHAFGIKTNGTLWAWGGGLLGNAGLSNSTVPVQIGTDTWLIVAAGENYSLGIKTDGTMWGWGVNGYGQTGTSGGSKSVPTQIGTDANWATVTAGKRHAIAIKTDGTMWSWGENSMDAGLGDGSTVSYRSTPGKIGTDTDWASVAAGNDHTMALKTNGRLYAFGYNGVGPLGESSLFSENGPRPIGSDTWSRVAVGTAHTIAISGETVTAINDEQIASLAEVNVYPNPNAGKFVVAAPKGSDGKTVVITSVFGEQVFAFNLNGINTEVSTVLQPGLYFLKIENSSSPVIKVIVR